MLNKIDFFRSSFDVLNCIPISMKHKHRRVKSNEKLSILLRIFLKVHRIERSPAKEVRTGKIRKIVGP
jgi:hypothetical protein